MKKLDDKVINVTDGEGKEERLLPLTSDIVFKRVFSRPGSEDILKDFIESILNIKIERWLWLISGEWGKLKMSEEGYEKIRKAVDEVRELSQNEEEWNLYVSRHEC